MHTNFYGVYLGYWYKILLWFTSGFWVLNVYSNNSYNMYNQHRDKSGGKNQAVVWLPCQQFWLQIFPETTQNTIINAPFSVVLHQPHHRPPSTRPSLSPTSLPTLSPTLLPAGICCQLPPLFPRSLPTATAAAVRRHPPAWAAKMTLPLCHQRHHRHCHRIRQMGWRKLWQRLLVCSQPISMLGRIQCLLFFATSQLNCGMSFWSHSLLMVSACMQKKIQRKIHKKMLHKYESRGQQLPIHFI